MEIYRTAKEWIWYLENAPESVKDDSLRYYANLRKNYNAGMSITKEKRHELIEFLKAIHSLGISSKELHSYAERNKR